jgi:hypothetical protein
MLTLQLTFPEIRLLALPCVTNAFLDQNTQGIRERKHPPSFSSLTSVSTVIGSMGRTTTRMPQAPGSKKSYPRIIATKEPNGEDNALQAKYSVLLFDLLGC